MQRRKKMRFLIIFIGSLLFGLNISVTILPQKGIVKEIAGNNAKINVMVPPGSSPATYDLSFKQLKDLKKADIYFTIGVPFDKKYI